MSNNGHAPDRTAEYGRFECRLCGDEVFVPLTSQALQEAQKEGRLYELTCSNGHTDSYDPSKIRSNSAKPVTSLKIRRAVAGVG